MQTLVIFIELDLNISKLDLCIYCDFEMCGFGFFFLVFSLRIYAVTLS